MLLPCKSHFFLLTLFSEYAIIGIRFLLRLFLENTAEPAAVLSGESAREPQERNVENDGQQNARNGENGISAKRQHFSERDHGERRRARDAGERTENGFVHYQFY